MSARIAVTSPRLRREDTEAPAASSSAAGPSCCVATSALLAYSSTTFHTQPSPVYWRARSTKSTTRKMASTAARMPTANWRYVRTT